VKPAPFEYFRPSSLEEALATMAAQGGDAKALAGGQSLVPAMNFRIAQPAALVDLNRVSELDGIEVKDDELRIGALTRQRALELSAVIREWTPLLADAMPFVAHVPIRTRGTLGGSLAHADPAAELPAVMLALDALIEVRSQSGHRTIAAREFFTGLYSTALAPDELITAVTIRRERAAGWAVHEVARRHGDFALAGAAAVVRLDATDAITDARLALFGVHERAVLAEAAMGTIAGHPPSAEAIGAAADAAATRDADPGSDIHASSAYRRHLTRVLVKRVLTRAVELARHGE
jgi:aerobic carbon-monoxide dehydrogenase medium subunit